MLRTRVQVSAARVANWVLLSLTVFFFFKVAMYKHPHRHIITHDTMEYYAYLPRTFIDHDPVMAHWEERANHNVWVHRTKGGTGRSLKMTMGLAMCYLPGFLLAHGLAEPLGYPADGYSLPYELAIFFSLFTCLAIGLYYLRRLLEHYFSPWAVCATLVLIMAATNMAWYTIWQPGMGHVFSFSFIAVFLWQLVRYREEPSASRAVAMGLLLGIITLIRPTNALLALFPLLYGVRNVRDLYSNVTDWLSRPGHVLLIAAMIGVVWLPQWLFWKATTGKWMYYSYRHERFFFDRPHLITGLFGYRNGWLLYTPVMVMAIAGLVMVYYRMREWFWPMLAFLCLFTYVVLCWWCWWYVGYGNRAFIDVYPVLALPLAALLHRAFQGKWLRPVFGGLVLLFLFHGVFQTIQMHRNLIHHDSMSREAYWAHFLKLKMVPNYWNMLETPDYHKAAVGIDALDGE